MSADPFADEEDDLGLEPQKPEEMSNKDLAEAVGLLAHRRRHTLERGEVDLLEEADSRLRLHAHLRDALQARYEQVQRLEAELALLRGDPADAVAQVGRWRRGGAA